MKIRASVQGRDTQRKGLGEREEAATRLVVAQAELEESHVPGAIPLAALRVHGGVARTPAQPKRTGERLVLGQHQEHDVALARGARHRRRAVRPPRAATEAREPAGEAVRVARGAHLVRAQGWCWAGLGLRRGSGPGPGPGLGRGRGCDLTTGTGWGKGSVRVGGVVGVGLGSGLGLGLGLELGLGLGSRALAHPVGLLARRTRRPPLGG